MQVKESRSQEFQAKSERANEIYCYDCSLSLTETEGFERDSEIEGGGMGGRWGVGLTWGHSHEQGLNCSS